MPRRPRYTMTFGNIPKSYDGKGGRIAYWWRNRGKASTWSQAPSGKLYTGRDSTGKRRGRIGMSGLSVRFARRK